MGIAGVAIRCFWAGEKINGRTRDYVLTWFGVKEGEAKKAYRDFVKRGIDQGRRFDLVGGELIRSQEGWSAVKTMRRGGVRDKSDERILGSGDFIEQLTQHSHRTRREEFPDQGRAQRAALLVEKVCKKEKVSVEALRAASQKAERFKGQDPIGQKTCRTMRVFTSGSRSVI